MVGAARQVPPHYLRENEGTWTPPIVAVFDTETRWVRGDDDERHELRLWCSRIVERRSTRRHGPVDRAAEGFDAYSLAEEITAWHRGARSVWCYAHNLNFDLTVTQLPVHLTAAGWDVTRMALGGQAPHLYLTHGSRHLRLLDSHSLFPVPVAQLAELVGIPKLPLPANDAPDSEWVARCRADVDATLTALLDLLDWWDAEQLGRFQSTGPGCGWSTYRHKLCGWKTLIDTTAERVRHDRGACYGGRRGIWRTGTVPGGPFAEIDLVSAYATVAAVEPLPTARWVHYDTLPEPVWERMHKWNGLLGTCEIVTDTPRWPCRVAGRVVYPVGRFRTVLAGPDVQDAHSRGALVSCTDAWLHRCGEHMQGWGKWVLDVLNHPNGTVPGVARVAVKGWSRSVVGRWAAHGWDTERWGPVTTTGWSVQDANGLETGTRGVLVNLNSEPWLIRQTEASESAYPAVNAFVEAHCRQVLNRVIDLIGQVSVVQCDTDGLIVDLAAAPSGPLAADGYAGVMIDPRARANALCEWLTGRIGPHRVRVKALHESMRVLGPQHYELGDTVKRSGIRADAEPSGPGRFVSYIWPALNWQLANSTPGVYTRPVRESVLAGPYATGWCLADGRVAPIELRLDGDGANTVVPFAAQSVGLPPAARLADVQPDFLTPYR
jgi:hypothetical protein